MEKKKVIVIGSDHFNTLWLVRSLGLAGFEPYCIIVGCKNKKSFVAKSKYCKYSYYVNDDEALPDFIMKLPFHERIAVFASGDSVAEVLDRNYNLLSSKYILHNCDSKQGEVLFWMDKKNMLRRAHECGLMIPRTTVCNLNEMLDFTKIEYPCLIKPEISAHSSKESFKICRSESELKKEIVFLKDVTPSVLLQNYVDVEYEYLVFGVSTEQEVYIPGGLRKIETCTSSKNLGMTSFAYYTPEIPEQIDDFEKIKRFVKSIGYHGLFSVEFMITKDNAYFLEINMRNDGTCYITTQSGVNMPAIWAYSCYKKDYSTLIPRQLPTRTYGMNGVNYVKYSLRKVGIVQSIKNIRKATAFSLYMKNDLKPLFYKFIYHYAK